MGSIDARSLAESMVRMYGKTTALAVASRYAAASSATNDIDGRERWSSVVSLIAELIEEKKQQGT